MEKQHDWSEKSNGSDSSPQLDRLPAPWSDRFKLLGQIATTAAIWDLARIGRIEGSHALFAMVAIAAPGLALYILSRKAPPPPPPYKDERPGD